MMKSLRVQRIVTVNCSIHVQATFSRLRFLTSHYPSVNCSDRTCANNAFCSHNRRAFATISNQQGSKEEQPELAMAASLEKKELAVPRPSSRCVCS